MKEYLRIPTHKKWGWLVQLVGMFLFSSLQPILGFLASLAAFALMIAFVVEIIAIVRGKNKPLKFSN